MAKTINASSTDVTVLPEGFVPMVQENNLMQDLDLGSYYSVDPQTDDEKINLYNCLNSPDERIADHINEVISVKDILVEMVELENDETGETTKCPRIILIDAEGKSYACVSVGIFSALQKTIKLFGAPTWTTPKKFKVKQITKGKKTMLSLEMVR